MTAQVLRRLNVSSGYKVFMWGYEKLVSCYCLKIDFRECCVAEVI